MATAAAGGTSRGDPRVDSGEATGPDTAVTADFRMGKPPERRGPWSKYPLVAAVIPTSGTRFINHSNLMVDPSIVR